MLLVGCPAKGEVPAAEHPGRDERPAWQQEMDEARRLTAAGNNYVFVVKPSQEGTAPQSGVYVFYNNPDPFCYAYSIPGEWVAAAEPNAYRSRDGRAFAGVTFVLPGDLRALAGATLVERMAASIAQEHESALGQALGGVELTRFESSRPGTWRWSAAPVTRGDRQIVLPPKIIVDLGPEAIVQITVLGTADDDALARRIIETLRTTSDSECYWPVLERLLRSALAGR